MIKSCPKCGEGVLPEIFLERHTETCQSTFIQNGGKPITQETLEAQIVEELSDKGRNG